MSAIQKVPQVAPSTLNIPPPYPNVVAEVFPIALAELTPKKMQKNLSPQNKTANSRKSSDILSDKPLSKSSSNKSKSSRKRRREPESGK